MNAEPLVVEPSSLELGDHVLQDKAAVSEPEVWERGAEFPESLRGIVDDGWDSGFPRLHALQA